MDRNIINKILITILLFALTEMILISNTLPTGVSIHRLDNGMEVLLIRNPGLPMIGANMVVKVGSAYETFATSGMSHMLEHLLFNGTKTRTQKKLYDDTDRIGGYNNANTSGFYTNYMMVTPKENFEQGLKIQADMLFNSTLPREKFNKEKGIVLEEISKSLAEPREQIERNIISIIYKGHALSLPTLGTYSTIKSMSRDEVYSFYKNNYVPNNMILSVVGDFNSAEMIDLINKIYGVKKPSDVARTDSKEWMTGFSNSVGLKKLSGIFHKFYEGKEKIIHNFFEIDKELNPSLEKLINISLQRESQKISKKFKIKFADEIKNIKFNLYTSPFKSYIEVRTILKKDRRNESVSREISNYMKHFHPEVDKSAVRAKILKSKTDFLKNIEKPHMFGIYNAHNFAVYGIESVLSLYNGSELIKSSDILKKLKFSDKPITLYQHPIQKKAKSKDTKIVSTKFFGKEQTGKSLIITNNGGSELLAIHYMFKHKSKLESKYGENIAKVLHQCFGNRVKSEENLKKMSRFGLSFKVNDNPFFPMDDIYLHPDFGYIRVEGLASDVSAVVNFLNSEMVNYEPSKSEFEKAYSEIKRMSNPMGMGNMAKRIFDKTYDLIIIEKDKYEKGSKKITFENLLKFTKEYFSPENMIISISSPEEINKVNKLYDDFFTKNGKVDVTAWDPGFRMRDKSIKIEKKGMGKRSYLFWGYTKKIDPNDQVALQALSLHLSDKIVFDIREKMGMAYRMSAGIKVKKGNALFYIKLGTRPKNVDKLLKIFPKFFNGKSVNNLAGTELERLVNMFLGRMMFRRLSSINRAYYYSYACYFKKDINYFSKFFHKLKNIKVENLKRVARKYLTPENPALIIVR